MPFRIMPGITHGDRSFNEPVQRTFENIRSALYDLIDWIVNEIDVEKAIGGHDAFGATVVGNALPINRFSSTDTNDISQSGAQVTLSAGHAYSMLAWVRGEHNLSTDVATFQWFDVTGAVAVGDPVTLVAATLNRGNHPAAFITPDLSAANTYELRQTAGQPLADGAWEFYIDQGHEEVTPPSQP